MLVMALKTKIRKEFKYILDLLDFDKKAHEIYRNWYIDGRIYYHKIIDLKKKPEEGIQELRYIDAMKMRYVRQQKKKPNDGRNNQLVNTRDPNPMDYDFPEIEEYFISNPKTHMVETLCSPVQIKELKLQKRCNYILHIWTC